MSDKKNEERTQREKNIMHEVVMQHGYPSYVVWDNKLVNAPVTYTLLEKRLIYLLTIRVKQKYTELSLDKPEVWKDLTFHLKEEDLALLGGKTHTLQTYEALTKVGEKFIPVQTKNDKGETLVGRVHWVDAFMYNTVTEEYDVRMSPEIMEYIVNLSHNFTQFNPWTALTVTSRYTQKLYEICCEFAGDVYLRDNFGNQLRRGVVYIPIEKLRYFFGLDEVLDPRTGKVLSKAKMKNFADVRKRILVPAQEELFTKYQIGDSHVWYDFLPFTKGRKTIGIYLFVYTKDRQKEDVFRPWAEGDEPLVPYDHAMPIGSKPKVRKKQEPSLFNDMPVSELEPICKALLSRYFTAKETNHYMQQIKNEARADNGYNDRLAQVIEVIRAKESQAKFLTGTKAYQKKNLKVYAFTENLKVYGWMLLPLVPDKSSGVS